MGAEKNLAVLLAAMRPKLNEGEYVFCVTNDRDLIDRVSAIGKFQEKEGTTMIIERGQADKLNLAYDYVAAWITLEVHSSLEAVGLTATFSSALAENNISCNVIAGFYHDHIFVDRKDGERALDLLKTLSKEALK